MSYVLGSLGAAAKSSDSNAALMAAGNVLMASVGETIKQGIKSGLTRYEVYNLVRFSDAKIKDPQLTARMNKGDYTPPFKLYRTTVGLALKASRLGAQVPAKEINDAAFEGFKTLYNTVLDVQDEKKDDKKLETKTAEDNTLIYVGVALGLVALAGAARRQRQ